MTVYPFVLYCSPYHGSIPIIMILDRSIFNVYILWLDKVICIWFTYSGGSDSEGSACNARRPRFNPWVGKIHWRREWQPTPVFLPGKFHGQRSLVGSMGSQRVRYDQVTDTFTWYAAFSNWLISLSHMHLSFLHVFPWLTSSFLFSAGSYSLSVGTAVCFSSHLLKDILIVGSTFNQYTVFYMF